MRDRVGRVHVHGCEPCIREPRHCLRDLRIRKIDAHSRAVADRLHKRLIPLRRRDGGVGLRRCLFCPQAVSSSAARHSKSHNIRFTRIPPVMF